MILPENRYPLFGIMHLTMLPPWWRSGAAGVTGLTVYAKALGLLLKGVTERDV
jgi:hypothetical protein